MNKQILVSVFRAMVAFLPGCTVVYAIGAYGGMPAWSRLHLTWIMSGCLMLWMASRLVRGSAPHVFRSYLFGLVFIAAWGICLDFFADYRTSSTTLQTLNWNLNRWPWSFTLIKPTQQAWYFVALALWMVAVADIGRSERWVKNILFTVIISGSIWCALGIFSVVSASTDWVWRWLYEIPRDQLPGYPFGNYFHHSVVAAQINLLWPIWYGLLLYRHDQDVRDGRMVSFQTALSGIGFFVCLVAMVINPSKAGLLFAVPGMALMYFIRRRYFLSSEGSSEKAIYPGWTPIGKPFRERALKFGIVGAILLALMVIGVIGGWETLEHRWSEFFRKDGEGLITNSRWEGWKTSLLLFAESKFVGFGPGSFMYVFPDAVENQYHRTFYLWLQFAHNDYIQILVELGLPGLIAWGFVFLGAVVVAFRKLQEYQYSELSLSHALFLGMFVSLVITLLHSTFDFPLQFPAVQLTTCLYVGLLWSRS